MNTYKGLVKIDPSTTELTIAELENTFEGLPFVWVSDGGGKFSTQRIGAFPEMSTKTCGTVIHYDSSLTIDKAVTVAVDRTSDDWIEVSVRDSNGDGVNIDAPIPVEFYVY